MATAYKNPSAGKPVLSPQGCGDLIARQFVIDWPTLTSDATYALVINDTVEMCDLPAFVKLYGGTIANTVDLDDGTSVAELDLIVSDGTTTYTILDGGTTTGAAGALTSLNGDVATHAGLYSVTDNGDYKLYVKAVAAANGDMASSAKTYVTIYYSGALEGNETGANRDFPSPIPS